MSNVPQSVINMGKNGRIDGIIITVTGYTYTPGRNSIKKNMSPDEYKDFMIYMSEQLLNEFVRAIDNQRYVSTRSNNAWKPLSLAYVTWKKKHKLSTNIWEATGHLKKSLKIFKKGNLIAVGFRQTDLYPKSFAKVNDIARFLEYGSRKIQDRPPARPLFRPITIYMRKNVKIYYKRYMKELSRTNKRYLYI